MTKAISRSGRVFAAISTAAFLLFGGGQKADADSKPLVQLHFDGNIPASMKYRDLSISADSAPSNTDAELKVPVFHLQFDDGRRLEVKFPYEPTSEPNADAAFSLDRSSSFPQIVLTYYWHGAHCCTVTKIVTMDASNKMIVVDGETLDADGYSFQDVDGDGNFELVSYDNSFLYAFASYAESVPPAKVIKLRGTRLVDVTDEESFRSILRVRLTEIESLDSESRKSNGYWGAGSRLGRS